MMPAELVVRKTNQTHRTRTTPYSQTYVPLSIQPLDGKRSVFVFGQGQLLGYTSARARAETTS